MAETNKKPESSLKNILSIGAFEARKLPKLQKEIEILKKRADDAQNQLKLKKEAINREIQARYEKEMERERAEREKDEAIRLAVSMPIIEHEEQVVKAEEPAPAPVETLAEVKTEVQIPVEETQPVAETPDVAAASEAKIEPKKEEKPEAKKADDIKSKLDKPEAAAILSPIFEKAKKQEIIKPVIRIYVPPEDNNRPFKKKDGGMQQQGIQQNRPQSGAPRTGDRPFGPRPGGNFAGGPRPMTPRIQPAAPILTTAGMKDALKKKADKEKDKEKEHTVLEQKKSINKKTLTKKGFVTDTSSEIEYDELSGEVKKVRSRKLGFDKKKFKFNQPQTTVIEHAILNKSIFTIKELSEKIGKTGAEIIKKLFLLNIIKTINDTIDFETAELVSQELGVSLELQHIETSEEKMIAYHGDEADDPSKLIARPPIVTIMGHVDHGKTSLLDYIRKSNVAAAEAGGITQHIGAYTITAGGSLITFLDTPGHEAFTAMRARGANVTDIAIIVVAADDGIMPQTIEAINHAKAAKVSLIIAVNKMDKADADPDRVLTQLTEHGIVPEEWGGNTPVVKVSAKTGAGMEDLLNTILITAEVMELKANPDRKARGTIIEASLDKGKGPVATVLVQNGTLRLSDYIVAGSITGKIRAMQDSRGKAVVKAGPSMAVAVLGFQTVPSAGDQIMVVNDEKTMKEIVDARVAKEQESKISVAKVSLDEVFKGIAEGKLKNLNIIVKADVQGSVEAIKDSLSKLSTDEVKVNIVHAGAGAINESDVMLADTTSSIIIGFNVRPDNKARLQADKDGIDIKQYSIIYDAIDDVQKVINGLSAPKMREEYLGKAEVRVLYKISGVGTIAGCMVKDGKVARNAKVRLIRNNIVVTETLISSLKRMKDDAKEVASGFECGIGLKDFNDIKEGDIIESFNMVEEQK